LVTTVTKVDFASGDAGRRRWAADVVFVGLSTKAPSPANLEWTYYSLVRRYIPYLILLVLTIASAGAGLLSWHQAHMSSITIYDCSSQSETAPSTLVLTCADANTLVKDLHWSNWGGATATATGVGSWNTCTPDCASGTWKSASVTIRAYRIRDDHYTRVNGSNNSLFGSGPFEASSYPPSS
jgi:hypothetical protein